jgi:DnaJ-class molecular chaperone
MLKEILYLTKRNNNDECPMCRGTGKGCEPNQVICYWCDGKGTVKLKEVDCWECSGKGKFINGVICTWCEGIGTILAPARIKNVKKWFLTPPGLNYFKKRNIKKNIRFTSKKK